MPGFCCVGNTTEAKRLIEICRKNCAFFGTGYNRRGHKEALIQAKHQAQIGAYLLSKARGAETVCASIYTGLCAADISSDGRQAATGVFDQTANDHIRTHIGGLDGFHEFTIAIIYHDDHIRFDLLTK